MIDLTPLDVHNKRGDFKKVLRGYDPQEVDVFLDLVAERLEKLVRENMRMQERVQVLEQQVNSQSGRERAVQEALVTAQELRSDMRTQAQREGELILDEARAQARRLTADAERKIELLTDGVAELERRRGRFLKAFRQLLERELDVVEVETERAPLEEQAIEMDLGGGRERMETEGEDEGRTRPSSPTEAPPRAKPRTGVDRSAEERPPLDAPVDELAAAYESSQGPGGEEEPKSARELVFPLRGDLDETEGGSRKD